MATTITTTVQDHCEQAAAQLHRAELALHDANQTGVDAWITAAADRLHEAVLAYTQSHAQYALAA